MQDFTDSRTESTPDEIWFLQHYPVYTQGTSCQDLPNSAEQLIPVVHSDRGGKMTYHGLGQLIVYFLMDIKRLGLGPKSLVNIIESITLACLSNFGIQGNRMDGAPGVYADGRKIAALGLRIRKGCCYHGLSINVDMDLSPFDAIVPCGLDGMGITQIAEYQSDIRVAEVERELKKRLIEYFDEYFD